MAMIVVRELYERGALRAPEFVHSSEKARRDALRKGLVNGPGRNNPQGVYSLTMRGRMLAECRLAPVHVPTTKRLGAGLQRKRGPIVLRPTWLAALPAANAVRLGDAP